MVASLCYSWVCGLLGSASQPFLSFILSITEVGMQYTGSRSSSPGYPRSESPVGKAVWSTWRPRMSLISYRLFQTACGTRLPCFPVYQRCHPTLYPITDVRPGFAALMRNLEAPERIERTSSGRWHRSMSTSLIWLEKIGPSDYSRPIVDSLRCVVVRTKKELTSSSFSGRPLKPPFGSWRSQSHQASVS